LLPGVLSSRLYLKRENRIAEHRMIRYTEPLYSLLSVNGQCAYPHEQLMHAWRLLLHNHPHDSICGCSVDFVHQEMMGRSAKLHQTLDTTDRLVLASLGKSGGKSAKIAPYAANAPGKAPIVDPALEPNRLKLFNLSGEAYSGPVRLTWAAEVGA